MLAMLALVAPTSLRGQALDHSASAPPSGPFELVGRAGVGALTFTRAAFAPSTVGIDRAELARGDTSDHHGSRAHHAAVGALIGGAVGLVLGVAGDRMWFGSGEGRGHFQDLWHITVPLGALVGALAGTL